MADEAVQKALVQLLLEMLVLQRAKRSDSPGNSFFLHTSLVDSY
jgi:hypothetical protein